MITNIDDFFSNPPSLKKYRSTNINKITSPKHTIYSLNALNDLLVILKTENLEERRVRFLIDSEGHLWFARERGGRSSPAHFQMTGDPSIAAHCIAAGTFYFKADWKTLEKIDHKSGDFRPDINSLKWVLLILAKCSGNLSFSLPETLEIDELDENNGPIHTHTVVMSQILQWAESVPNEQAEKVKEQSHKTKVVEYQRPSNRNEEHSPQRTIPLSAKRLSFFDTTGDEPPSVRKKLCFNN